MKKFLTFIIIVVAAVYFGSQYYLPQYVGNRIATQLESKLSADDATVRVDSSPAMALLWGQIDVFRGDVENVQLGKLVVSDIHFDLSHLSISPQALLLNHQVVLTSMGTGSIEGTVTQANLKTFLESSISGFKVEEVHIRTNTISMSGPINLGGLIQGRATITGELEIKNNALYFAPEHFAINGMDVSGMNMSVMKSLRLYDFSTFPIPVTAYKIESSGGAIHIFVKPRAN
ncbi:MAG: LmeA family phospholipid-binding protein [Veillonellaceae bacterium]|nr:LmeA family phospholipid-binding protein [Veillonellaceae bacterium]